MTCVINYALSISINTACLCRYEDVQGALDGGQNGLDIVLMLLRNTKHIINPNG